MFKNYLKVALRNTRKQKAYALINITGFAVGMASCILIMLYVLSELSYDKFHKDAERIYRIGIEGKMGADYVKFPLSNLGAAGVMRTDFPEVESITRIFPRGRITAKYQDKINFEDDWYYADEYFFKVFTFPLTEGDPDQALAAPYSMVITRDFANKYFGREDPLGKQMNIDGRGNYTVTGVMENIPKNSHFEYDFLVSLETYYEINNRRVEEWNNFNNYTYVKLKENADLENFTNKFPGFIKKNMAILYQIAKGNINFFTQPLMSIHLHSNLGYELSGNSDIAYVYIFSGIAFFILLIACINFMNLSTARSAKRAKEVGLRKVMGAEKGRLVRQFLSESMLYSIFSLIIAVILVQLVIPVFSSLSGNDLSLNLGQMSWLIPSFLGFIVLTGLLAGSYPAFFLSAFQPISVMRGALKAGAANTRFRSILVVIQFTISVALITGTTVMLNQLSFMKKQKLGFDKEHVVTIEIMDGSIRERIETIKKELEAYSGVISVAASSDVPGNEPDYSAYVPEGYTLEETQLIHRINADADFIPTMGMEIITGRNFSKEIPTDRENSIIINETAAKRYGWDDPLGKTIGQFRDNNLTETRPLTVIGVVKDFHVKSLHDKILPLLLTNNTGYLNTVSIRISPADIQGTISFLKSQWQKYDPSRPFEYEFLDREFDEQYRADERLSKIIRYFTIFAIFVACLGLYGMASFMAEQRFKEIGIRKTLGASNSNILILLNMEVTKLILIANIIAIPVAYYFLHKWLESFAYRTSLSVFTFLISAAIVFFIGYITIIYQSMKAAMTNPVNAIRTE